MMAHLPPRRHRMFSMATGMRRRPGFVPAGGRNGLSISTSGEAARGQGRYGDLHICCGGNAGGALLLRWWPSLSPPSLQPFPPFFLDLERQQVGGGRERKGEIDVSSCSVHPCRRHSSMARN